MSKKSLFIGGGVLLVVAAVAYYLVADDITLELRKLTADGPIIDVSKKGQPRT